MGPRVLGEYPGSFALNASFLIDYIRYHIAKPLHSKTYKKTFRVP